MSSPFCFIELNDLTEFPKLMHKLFISPISENKSDIIKRVIHVKFCRTNYTRFIPPSDFI